MFVEIAGHYTIMQFNSRHFKILQLEKLALFNLAYFCHPPIKPKFPSRQNYPIYGIHCNCKMYSCWVFGDKCDFRVGLPSKYFTKTDKALGNVCFSMNRRHKYRISFHTVFMKRVVFYIIS